MRALRAHLLTEHGEPDVERFALALLPSNGRRISNLPERRRRRLRDHLNRLVGAAAAQAARRESAPVPARAEPEESAEELAVLGAGCATCRGHCCPQGGDHAFLDVTALRRHLAEHPDARPRQVLEAYLARLPQKSYQGSCVYHTARGCALPRDMRADICNEWYCDGLHAFRAGMARTRTQRGFAVATEGGRVLRAARIDADGAHELPVAGAGAAGPREAGSTSSVPPGVAKRQNGLDATAPRRAGRG